MDSLMESYEQQFGSLTADITSKIGKIPNVSGKEKVTIIENVEKLMDETRELLEQMDLEVRSLPVTERQKYQIRLKSYKSELTQLEKNLKKSKIAFSDHVHAREELLGDETQNSEDQRTRLLDNTERLERSSKRLEHGYQTVLETEQIGAAVLDDLHSQRQTIQRSRERLRETDAALGKSSRILSGMMRRIIQNRAVLVVVGIIILIVIIVGIYFAAKK
ncbi:vesicle transport through interaction with t-SNAREs homolog 1A [Lingula anatina]|uniref:Vesicle transport through interaction with t-SNAREs homolog 1A n=1 Tax=Lingula anatina TaxID=7574 RepID=A0A1S3HIM2_LINAN|nr:vesicle transport through interaction with t-SNAREs homolog 1A [Lingula anatina]|eukprot:XP_013385965.1 vesicle transport through interaction with t-SNAREs homolog 1A [Lingula anatina]